MNSTAMIDAPRKLTPPQVAKTYGVSPERIIAWIRAGELVAIDVSGRPGVGRPRFRIDPADLVAFDARRAVVTTPKASRRRRKDPSIVEFF